MITKEKVLKVVARLKTVEELANKKGAFDMMEVNVDFDNKGHPCGTVHCLGGLYVVANYKRPEIINARAHSPDPDEPLDYNHGAYLMAKDLGFKGGDELKHWIDTHPKEWGNNRGYFLFSQEDAFNHKGFSGVIRHFEEFAGRLKC